MAERKGKLLIISIGLFCLAFIAGLAISFLSKDVASILEKFKTMWLILSSVLIVGTWGPAILLIAAALNTEEAGGAASFSAVAMKSLAPALILAGIISLFYLLAVPLIEAKKSWYEQSSALFSDSLKKATEAFGANRLLEAENLLHISGSINNKDPAYLDLTEKVQSGLAQAAIVKDDTQTLQPEQLAEKNDEKWKAGNQFYLDALKAQEEKRTFDAHYLAKRSAAIFPDRIEVQRLIAETWAEMQKSGPSQEELDAADLYRSKLEGYKLFESGNFVGAFQTFNDLLAKHPADQDIVNYKKRSEEALKNVAFFIEEDIRAFSGSGSRAFLQKSRREGIALSMHASQAAISSDGVFFRNLELELGGAYPAKISAPFARLHGTTLTLRAVDRKNPNKVWSATWKEGGGKAPDGLIADFPYTEEDATFLLTMSQKPKDVPLLMLATSTEKAKEMGIDPKPLRVEFAARVAYPFITIMVVLFGAALGMRFKAKEAPGALSRLLGGPILTALALVPLSILSKIGFLLATLLAMHTQGAVFIASWAGILAVGVAIALLFSARASMHAPS